MHRLRSPAALATALLAGFSVATPAEAARDRIGGAVVVEREVSGSLPGAEHKVAPKTVNAGRNGKGDARAGG